MVLYCLRLISSSRSSSRKHLVSMVAVMPQLALGAYYREGKGEYVQVEPDFMTQDEILLVISQFIDAAVMVVGGFRSVQAMEEVLSGSRIELLCLSRPLLREPDLPNRMKECTDVVSRCISCNGCYSSPAHRCIFRGREHT